MAQDDDDRNGAGTPRYQDVITELFTITNILLTMPPGERSDSLHRRYAELLAELGGEDPGEAGAG